MDYGEGSGLVNDTYKRKSNWLVYLFVVLFILWNVLVFILAVVALAKSNNHDTKTTVKIGDASLPVIKKFNVATGAQVKFGEVVSYLPNSGGMRLGAGTSAYLNKGSSIPVTSTVKNIRIDSFLPLFVLPPLESEEAIVAYEQGDKVYVVLGTVSPLSTTIQKWGTPQEVTGLTGLEDLVALGYYNFALTGPNGQVAFGVRDGVGSLEFKTSIAVTKFGENTSSSKIALLDSPQGSVNSFNFAVIFLDADAQSLQAVGGDVVMDGNNAYKSNTFTAPISFPSTTDVHTLFRMGPSSFTVSYSTGTLPNNALESVLVTSSSNVLTPGDAITLEDVHPSFYLAGVGISDNHGALVFIDESKGGAVRTVLIKKDTYSETVKINGIVYGTSLDLTEADAVPTGISPILDAVLIGDSLAYGVVFNNFAQDGKLQTVIVQMDSANDALSLKTPVMTISTEAINITNKEFHWASACSLQVKKQIGYWVIDSLSKSGALDPKTTNTLVEIAPEPFGIATEDEDDKVAAIAVAGIVDFKQDIFGEVDIGATFYADTQGLLLRQSGSNTQYIQNGNVITTKDSQVGVCLSKSELLIRTN